MDSDANWTKRAWCEGMLSSLQPKSHLFLNAETCVALVLLIRCQEIYIMVYNPTTGPGSPVRFKIFMLCFYLANT